jgi:hypothetical protein
MENLGEGLATAVATGITAVDGPGPASRHKTLSVNEADGRASSSTSTAPKAFAPSHWTLPDAFGP